MTDNEGTGSSNHTRNYEYDGSISTARYRTQIRKLTIVVIGIQFLTLVLLLIFSPSDNLTLWTILLFFFSLTWVFAAFANRIVLKAATRIAASTVQIEREEGAPGRNFIRDPLTNLFTRFYLEETLERELHRSLRGHASLGIIVLDIDHLKNFNDTYGNIVGDMMLKKLAGNLQQSVRISDLVCRFENDKFILIINDASRDLAMERAEHIRAEAENIKLDYEGQNVEGVTISAGVAVYPEHGTTMDTLMKNADLALHHAKFRGRNQVVLYQKNLE